MQAGLRAITGLIHTLKGTQASPSSSCGIRKGANQLWHGPFIARSCQQQSMIHSTVSRDHSDVDAPATDLTAAVAWLFSDYPGQSVKSGDAVAEGLSFSPELKQHD